MALKNLPPGSPKEADQHAALLAKARPLAERIEARDLTLISIGDRCLTSGVLEKLGLRSKAFPFDWLFSSLEMIEHCLRDNFAEFLNPRQYERVPLTKRAKPTVNLTDHRLYRDNFGIDHVFNHHAMPDKLAHFQRAVGRFRQAPNPHLLHITQSPPLDILAEVEAVARVSEAKVLAVCVAPDPTLVRPEIRHFAGGEDYDVFDMASQAPLRALGFGGFNDEKAFASLLLEQLDKPSSPPP